MVFSGHSWCLRPGILGWQRGVRLVWLFLHHWRSLLPSSFMQTKVSPLAVPHFPLSPWWGPPHAESHRHPADWDSSCVACIWSKGNIWKYGLCQSSHPSPCLPGSSPPRPCGAQTYMAPESPGSLCNSLKGELEASLVCLEVKRKEHRAHTAGGGCGWGEKHSMLTAVSKGFFSRFPPLSFFNFQCSFSIFSPFYTLLWGAKRLQNILSYLVCMSRRDDPRNFF